MSTSTFYKQWKLVLIDHDEKKVEKLRSVLDLTVHHFRSVLHFTDHLNAVTDARQCLILLVPTSLIRDLSSDIEQKLHKLYVYGEQFEEATLSFDDICLRLSNLVLAQCTEQLIYFRHSKENGLVLIFAQENIDRTKLLIGHLQDLCDDIEENIAWSQEEKN